METNLRYFERAWLRDAGCPLDSGLPIALQRELYGDLLALGPNYESVMKLWGYFTSAFKEDEALMAIRLKAAVREHTSFISSEWTVRTAFQQAVRWEPRLSDEDEILIRYWESLTLLTRPWMNDRVSNAKKRTSAKFSENEIIFMMLWALITKDTLDSKAITTVPAPVMREQLQQILAGWNVQL